MRKKMIIGLILISGVIILTAESCNYFTRNFGGTLEYEVPAGEKVVNVTWKDSDIWVLTRKMQPNEKPDTLRFSESSTFGVFEGDVILYEKSM